MTTLSSVFLLLKKPKHIYRLFLMHLFPIWLHYDWKFTALVTLYNLRNNQQCPSWLNIQVCNYFVTFVPLFAHSKNYHKILKDVLSVEYVHKILNIQFSSIMAWKIHNYMMIHIITHSEKSYMALPLWLS